MRYRPLPEPLGRSLRNSLLKPLLTVWTWPNASARTSPYASTNAPARTAQAIAHAYAHACSLAPAHSSWKLWLWVLWADAAAAKQMSTRFWTSNGPASWSNCYNWLWCLRQRYAHLWGSLKWMDAGEQLDDKTLAPAACAHAYAHA